MRYRLLLVIGLAACGGDEGQVMADGSRVIAESSQPSAVRGRPSSRPACPATGNWSQCAIVERLDRAGLVPRLDSGRATEPPLTPPGILVRVGTSELELYIYADPRQREHEQSMLPREKYVDYATPVSMRDQATLISSANLIAILHSRNDHQRERIGDAITAGPPQPPKP